MAAAFSRPSGIVNGLPKRNHLQRREVKRSLHAVDDGLVGYRCSVITAKRSEKDVFSSFLQSKELKIASGFIVPQKPRMGSFNRRDGKGSRVVRSMQVNGDGVDGDPRVQQMLVEMLRIQMGRVRVNDFVEERSEHMRQIAEDSNVELNRIANQAMKRVDKAGSRVLRELDAGAFAIERDLEIARAEIEAYERDFEEFEARANYSRNEGLFFKSLYPMPKSMSYRKAYAKPVQRVKLEITTPQKVQADSMYSTIVYTGLCIVTTSFVWSASSALIIEGTPMRSTKLMAYLIIISLLLLQLRFEKEILGKDEESAE